MWIVICQCDMEEIVYLGDRKRNIGRLFRVLRWCRRSRSRRSGPHDIVLRLQVRQIAVAHRGRAVVVGQIAQHRGINQGLPIDGAGHGPRLHLLPQFGRGLVLRHSGHLKSKTTSKSPNFNVNSVQRDHDFLHLNLLPVCKPRAIWHKFHCQMTNFFSNWGFFDANFFRNFKNGKHLGAIQKWRQPGVGGGDRVSFSCRTWIVGRLPVAPPVDPGLDTIEEGDPYDCTEYAECCP